MASLSASGLVAVKVFYVPQILFDVRSQRHLNQMSSNVQIAARLDYQCLRKLRHVF